MPSHATIPKHRVSRTTPRTRNPVARNASKAAVLSFPTNSPSTKAAATKLFAKFSGRSALPLGTLRAQLIPDSSWKRSTETLAPTAAETVARLARALTFAARTWGNEPDAIDWMLGPHIELRNATPYSLLRTESGGRAVENLMAALEFGFPV